MVAHLRILIPVILVLWSASATAARGQSEMARERASLRGVEGFYLSLNVEGMRSVVGREGLDFDTLHRRLRTRLEAAGLPLWPEADVAPERRLPYLHVHVNTMDAGRGVVPFGVEIRFYQGVHLARDPSAETVATTWSTSVVGVTFQYEVQIIADAAVDLVQDFIDDFHQVNP